jgi:AcrR family transcriptional regulator
MKPSERTPTRREPRQERARHTVEAVLGGVRRVLSRHGAAAVTTNRVAEAAGVSIGSLYQYFPDKQAIFAALHERHVEEVRLLIERTMTECTSASLPQFTTELVERLASVHAEDADLHALVSASVPGADDGFKGALQATFEQAIAPRQDRYGGDTAERLLFVLPQLVEGLVHGVAEQTHARARARARDEALRTVAVYLNSYADH